MFDRRSTFGDAIDHPGARAVLERFLPGVAASPMATQFRGGRLGQLVAIVPSLEDPDHRARFWEALAEIVTATSEPPYAPAIAPSPTYEGDEVARGSARVRPVPRTTLGRPRGVRVDAPSHGNPFVDADAHATFRRPDGSTARVGGFYDGEGEWVFRALADAEGTWSFETDATTPVARRPHRNRGGRVRGIRVARSGARRRLPTSGTPTASATDRWGRPPTRGRISPRHCRSRRWRHSPRARSASSACACSRSRTSSTRTSPTTSSSPVRWPTGSTWSASTRRTSAARTPHRPARRPRDRGRPHPVPRLRPAGDSPTSVPPRTTGTSGTSCAGSRRSRTWVVARERIRPRVGQGRGRLGAHRRDPSARRTLSIT